MIVAWERFWFEPESTATMVVLRMVFGIIALGWTISLAPDLSAFFSTNGLVASGPGGAGAWGVLAVFHGDLAVQLLFAVLLVACVALILGYQTRLAALLVFIGITSFERRNPWVFNTGDGLIRLIALYLMLMPAGAAISLDKRLAAPGRAWEFPRRAPWALRLMQIQLAVIYIAGLWIKLQGTTWNNGTAVSYAMRISDLTRFPLPGFLIHSALLSNLMTFGTLAIEFSVPILIWNRRLRPWVMLAGISLHLGIEYSIRVGFFSLGMLVMYLSFVDPAWAELQLLHVRDWLRRKRTQSEQARPAPTPLPEH
ncbi:MAG: HTTM domain-containing protein [Actinobacteria bacterium]|nr:HTTM domain-containing protein [Actinomycetota bacterium]